MGSLVVAGGQQVEDREEEKTNREVAVPRDFIYSSST